MNKKNVVKKISGHEYPLSKIFSSEFEYVIPSYQRPYAWTVDQSSELFDDLYEFYKTEPDEGYFLGSIVLIKEETIPRSEVIDGQQRLTTLTVLFALLASKMEGSSRDSLRGYIHESGKEFEGVTPKPRLTIRDRDQEFFAKYIQNLEFDSLDKLDAHLLENESRRNLQTNSKLLSNRLEQHFGNDINAMKKFVEFLLQRCFLVAVSTPSQKSAFRVFSVMNSRGLDLQTTDIIKADTIGLIDTVEKQNVYNNRWEEMEVVLGRNTFNDMFSYIRMIYAKEKAKRALLEEFRSHVLSEVKSPIKLIEDVLEPYADVLATIRNANYEASANTIKINTYLNWLNRIDNSDWIPPAMLFLANHKNNPEYVLWFFKRLERLAACMHVCAKNVNQRIERYSNLISGLERSHSQHSPVAEVELSSEEKENMRTVLNGDIYNLTARRRNYIILRLDSFMSDGAATYDQSVLTIEHVLPQTVNPDSQWATTWPSEELRRQWIHKIANLVPLNFRRNVQASNYDFEKKKTAYFGGKQNVSSYLLTTQVLNTSSWSPEHVKQRQVKLLDIFTKNWELSVL